MTYESARRHSRSHVEGNHRQVALGSLLVGALLLVGAIVALRPVTERYGSETLSCGSPLYAITRSGSDYVADSHNSALRAELARQGIGASPGLQGYVAPDASTTGLAGAGRACVGDSRTPAVLGAGLLVLGVVVAVLMILAARRRGRLDADD